MVNMAICKVKSKIVTMILEFTLEIEPIFFDIFKGIHWIQSNQKAFFIAFA